MILLKAPLPQFGSLGAKCCGWDIVLNLLVERYILCKSGSFWSGILHYKTPETPANKGKTAHTSGFHVGASNRNRTLCNNPKKPWNKGIFVVCVEFRVE